MYSVTFDKIESAEVLDKFVAEYDLVRAHDDQGSVKTSTVKVDGKKVERTVYVLPSYNLDLFLGSTYRRRQGDASPTDAEVGRAWKELIAYAVDTEKKQEVIDLVDQAKSTNKMNDHRSFFKKGETLKTKANKAAELAQKDEAKKQAMTDFLAGKISQDELSAIIMA